MEIIINDKEQIKIVEIIGKLDGSSSEQAEESISALITDHCQLIFDMSQCDYISSAGLRVLLVTAKKLKIKSGHAVTCGLIEEVKDVMEMTGFDNMFDNYDTLELAFDAMRNEG